MKNFLQLFFVVMLLAAMAEAQEAVLSMDKMNVAYMGVDNPVSIAITEHSCSEIIVECSNGSLEGKECRYVFKPAHAGEAIMTIKLKQGNDTVEIGKSKIRVKRIPDPVISMGFLTNSMFENGKTALIPIMEMDFELFVRIAHFRMTVLRNDTVYLQEEANDNRYTSPMKKYFSEMVKCDVITIDQIKVSMPDNSKRDLAPVTEVYTGK
jgi:hypothetical protein